MPYLVQIDGYDPVAGAAVTLRAASVDDSQLCHLDGANGVWWPVIATLPELRYDILDGGFSGKISTPESSIVLGTEPWPNFPRYNLSDARVRIWEGTPGLAWASWTLRYDGRSKAQPNVSAGRASLTFGVDDAWLDKPLLTLYAGTGGAEGDAPLKGVPKPLALGAPRFTPGLLVDTNNLVFQVSAYGLIEDVEVAFERILRFQASAGNYATHALLVAASIPAGAWATCKAEGKVRHGAPPVQGGRFTYHVKGDKAGPDGWVRLPGQLIKRLALIGGGTGRFSEASVDALDIARPWNVSFFSNQQLTIREAIYRVAASVNAVAGVDWLGQLVVWPLPSLVGAAAVTLDATGASLPPVSKIEQIPVDPPYWRMAIETEKTWDVHELSDIAFTAVLADRGAYSATETYREGNIVQSQGVNWYYINGTPGAGNAPPTLPATSNAWWKGQPAGPTVTLTVDAEAFTFVDGVATPGAQSINFTAVLTNSAETVNFSTSPTVTLTGAGLSRSLSLANFGANNQVVVTATGATSGASHSRVVTRLDRSTAAAGATADLILTSFGTQAVSITGNRFIRDAGNVDYNAVVRAQAIPGPSYVEADINPTGWTIIALDDDTTNVTYDTQTIIAHYNAATGALAIYGPAGATLLVTTIATGIAGKLLILYDNVGFRVAVGGVTYGQRWSATSDLKLYPKWWSYHSGVVCTGLRGGPAGESSDFALTLTPAPAQTILCDYLHAPLAGQSPRLLTNSLKKGTVDVASSGTWTYTPSGCTVSTAGLSAGQVNATPTADNASVTVSVLYQGVTKTEIVPLTKAIGDPPSGGGGAGATAYSVDVSGTITDTAYDGSPQVIASSRMRSSGSGAIRFILNADYNVFGLTRTATMAAKAQTSPDNVTWTDASIAATNNASAFGGTSYDAGDAATGNISANSLKTGLTASTDYYVRWIAYCTFGGGASTAYPVGTAQGQQT